MTHSPRACRRAAGLLALVFLALVTAGGRAAAAEPFDVRDAGEFAKCVDVAAAKVEKLAGDMKFTEGPVWVPQRGGGDGFLVFSDIPADELKKWSAKDGLSTFRRPSDMVNGNALDADGRLLHASHGRRQVLRTEKDGSVTVLAEAFEGKKLNSPNDLAVRSDGTIFFTDPPYGLPRGVESELGFRGVYRLDPKTKQLALLVKDMPSPNGIALSPDEKTLYVAMSDPKNPVIRAFPLAADGSVGPGRDLCRLDKGVPDGIKVDADGRVWSSAGDGVHVYAPDGKLLGKILVPESPANLCFGGPDGRTLFVTARKSLYAIPVKVTGTRRMKVEG